MAKACANCVYYHPAEPTRAVPHGQCRIGPPQPSKDRVGARWPLVWADEWCGCHHPAEEPLKLFAPDAGGEPNGAA